MYQYTIRPSEKERKRWQFSNHLRKSVEHTYHGWLGRDSLLEHGQLQTQRRQWQPTPVLLPGKSHGWRSLLGCSPWDREELDMTERLRFHFSLSCIGEGNGNPLQCSCLENPRDGRAWWAAIYGVAQSQTWLKWLSSSSSSYRLCSSCCRFLNIHSPIYFRELNWTTIWRQVVLSTPLDNFA